MQAQHIQPRPRGWLNWLPPLLIVVLGLSLYAATLAPDIVFGDPAEYTFIPHIWGTMHPPGYAFMTLLGGLWQRIVPIGSIPYRANLLSATAGAVIAMLAFISVRTLARPHLDDLPAALAGVFAALSTLTVTTIWQHSLHANSHIISALLAAFSLTALIQWWQANLTADANNDRWLYVFCVLAGVSVTHHPLLVFSFPAYTVFIITARPRILISWRTLLAMAGFGMLGLAAWLYFPLRANLQPPIPFGAQDLNTLDGFLQLALARGLRVNLFHFGLAEQGLRLRVLLSLLSSQTVLPVLLLALGGLIWAWGRRWYVGLLLTVFEVINLLFILNTIQDVMAYLMVPLVGLMLLAGLGAVGLFELIARTRTPHTARLIGTAALLLLVVPVVHAARLAPVISLAEFTETRDWVEEVYDTFEGQGEGAILLGHWEHLTPLWVAQYVEDRPFNEDDLELVFVASGTARPWVDAVWSHIDDGPIYVSGYQADIIAEGFRLRPVGSMMYRVLPPSSGEMIDLPIQVGADAGIMSVEAAFLPEAVEAGRRVPFTLALTLNEATTDIIFPEIWAGGYNVSHTTDSHWLTPWWNPGETISERYDFYTPFDAEPGDMEVTVRLRNLSTGEYLMDAVPVGSVTITPYEGPVPRTNDLSANIGNQVGLVEASIRAGGRVVDAPTAEPIPVSAGDVVHLSLRWRALASPGDNWKIFVHVVDGAGTIVEQVDYPPLGGAFPTYLWFPKWLPGQELTDPYRLELPADLPPGDYMIRMGFYGFNTAKRLHFYDPSGNLSGDQFILGTLRIEG